ncbi:hypothetical protein SERLADRAFT_412020 [Serpula lacrymans var. lacrymans S7.9]|uniref:Uncharacterized protein n=1 Tax=Serpula lacrymans var. lacrymans (strain S7.9) TaxID=578457 RepID=F8PDE5_SERL9|nr:uncharacterized protein SERLADRAFT_412020 [Serpula lacrymans var. lacrymans S7.9]EGO18766.1 hypothetical protein SERLADRAFT_412020 [Serpula lacrymans var. lacrymans S7.9]
MPRHMKTTLVAHLKASFDGLPVFSSVLGSDKPFKCLHFSWWNRYGTQGCGAPIDAHPHELDVTNETQMIPYLSKEGSDNEQLYLNLQDAFADVFQWISDVMEFCLPDEYSMLAKIVGTLPGKPGSPVTPFLSLVININGFILELKSGDFAIFRSKESTHFNLDYQGERASFVLYTDGFRRDRGDAGLAIFASFFLRTSMPRVTWSKQSTVPGTRGRGLANDLVTASSPSPPPSTQPRQPRQPQLHQKKKTTFARPNATAPSKEDGILPGALLARRKAALASEAEAEKSAMRKRVAAMLADEEDSEGDDLHGKKICLNGDDNDNNDNEDPLSDDNEEEEEEEEDSSPQELWMIMSPSIISLPKSSTAKPKLLHSMACPINKCLASLAHKAMRLFTVTEKGFPNPLSCHSICWDLLVKATAAENNSGLMDKMKEIQDNQVLKSQLLQYVRGEHISKARISVPPMYGIKNIHKDKLNLKLQIYRRRHLTQANLGKMISSKFFFKHNSGVPKAKIECALLGAINNTTIEFPETAFSARWNHHYMMLLEIFQKCSPTYLAAVFDEIDEYVWKQKKHPNHNYKYYNSAAAF